MNLEEETYLSAYLDGELTPEQRERVDAALLSDPALGEGLGALATVRDLVVNLSRPAVPFDASARIVAELRARRLTESRRLALAGRLGALAAAAAAVVAAATLSFRDPTRPPADGPGFVAAPPVPPTAAPDPEPTLLARESEPADDPRRWEFDPAERRQERERTAFRRMVDADRLHGLLLLTDVIGDDPAPKVHEIVDTTPRRQSAYGRVRVAQGLLLDPDHPGDAVVYAVVMDDRELHDFREKLDKSFPNAVRTEEPRAELLTQLSEVGQVSVFPGRPEARLLALGDEPARALRARDEGPGVAKAANRVNTPRPPAPVADARPPGEAPVAEEVAGAAPPDASRPAPRKDLARSDDPLADLLPRDNASVVLVWVGPPRKRLDRPPGETVR